MATPNAAARSRYSARRRTMVNQSPAMGLLHLEGDVTRDRMRVRGDGAPFDAIVTGLERLCRRDDHGLAVAGSRDAGVEDTSEGCANAAVANRPAAIGATSLAMKCERVIEVFTWMCEVWFKNEMPR